MSNPFGHDAILGSDHPQPGSPYVLENAPPVQIRKNITASARLPSLSTIHPSEGRIDFARGFGLEFQKKRSRQKRRCSKMTNRMSPTVMLLRTWKSMRMVTRQIIVLAITRHLPGASITPNKLLNFQLICHLGHSEEVILLPQYCTGKIRVVWMCRKRREQAILPQMTWMLSVNGLQRTHPMMER